MAQMEPDDEAAAVAAEPLDPSGGGLGKRVDLKVGFTCNNRCVFCVQGDKREHYDDRTTAEVKEILQARRSDADGVVFTGGEASVRKDIIEIVRYAREMGYETIQLQTNGRRMAYFPFVQALVKAGITEVSPALHGSVPAIHDRLTRAQGAYQQVIQGIKNARKLGIPVITNSVVVKDNVRDLPRLGALLASLGVIQVQFAYVHPAGTAEELFHQVVARFPDAMPFIHKALDTVRNAGVRAYTEAVPYCFMWGYEEHVVERNIPETCVVDAPFIIDDYRAYRLKEGKAKGEPCNSCTFDRYCEGPWHEYPREYGWDEFEPRKDDPVQVLGLETAS